MPTFGRSRFLLIVSLLLLAAAREAQAQPRLMRPDDLFRIERVGPITWSPDRHRATVEMPRPGRWIDPGIPTAAIAVVDVATAKLRTISPSSAEFVGFFGVSWSPDAQRLLFLSVDTNAVVRPWLWDAAKGKPVLLPGLELKDALVDPPVALWSDDDHALFMLRENGAKGDGPLYFKINRGRNVADRWAEARRGSRAAVSVFDSRGAMALASDSATTTIGTSRIVSVDLRTRATMVLARGALHRPQLSADRRTLIFRRESPPLAAAPASSFFGPDARGESTYDRPNWGTETVYVDSRTGAPAIPPDSARRAAGSPAATLRIVSDMAQGTRLMLGRPGQADVQLWNGNQWARTIAEGRAERIAYASVTGQPLTGWFLYPPGYVAGQKLPVVTVVYPGVLQGQTAPSALSVFTANFEHPQLFAALGYGVLFPSMPEPATPLASHALDSLALGVFPLLDTLIARGIADSARIALLGQSAGGHATLGLITQTNRFRTAVASASYSDLASLYGTFYGQYRYGDAGSAQRAQLLRMLQFERGYFGADAPPWEAPERYRDNSPLWHVAAVHTPVMLVHGDADFIPVQQAEEFFSALYRQDKRVRFVRYTGEEHTISARENVLDLWQRLEAWLRETMPPR